MLIDYRNPEYILSRNEVGYAVDGWRYLKGHLCNVF